MTDKLTSDEARHYLNDLAELMNATSIAPQTLSSWAERFVGRREAALVKVLDTYPKEHDRLSYKYLWAEYLKHANRLAMIEEEQRREAEAPKVRATIAHLQRQKASAGIAYMLRKSRAIDGTELAHAKVCDQWLHKPKAELREHYEALELEVYKKAGGLAADSVGGIFAPNWDKMQDK